MIRLAALALLTLALSGCMDFGEVDPPDPSGPSVECYSEDCDPPPDDCGGWRYDYC